ncbi:MAG: glutaredoxin family protein [Actinomycetota bacterium]|nr:glutaredoxin family protein [Actinomycetota bacterium]
MDQPAAHRVQLLSKPQCHLCDDARVVVTAVCAELDIPWTEQSIMEDPALYDEFWERIPVVLIDERVAQFWRVNPELLRGALSG